MSKVRTDFYFTYSSEKLKAARERLRISQGETARRAQIRDGTYNGYERGATKTISGSNACKVALALRCEVSELFDNYEAARLHFSSREARKLTEEDRRSYAENNIGLVRFFVNSYLSLWDGDFDEGFSEALEVFFKALVDFRKPEKEEETETALRAYIKRSIYFAGLMRHKKEHEVDLLSLSDPVFSELDEGGANSGERLRCVVSPYDVEEHVEAREELRYKLRKADPATRRIVYMDWIFKATKNEQTAPRPSYEGRGFFVLRQLYPVCLFL